MDVPKSLRQKKMFGGLMQNIRKVKEKKQKADEKNKIQKNLKEKILPKQKKKRLEELRKELK